MGTSLGANAALEAVAQAPERFRGMVIEMPVLDHALIGCAIAFTPLMVALTAGEPAMRLLARTARLVPRRTLPWQADILLDWIRQDPEPSAAVLQGLFFGRTAPPREERRRLQTPALVIGHQYDLIHPFSDAGMLVVRAAERTVAGSELADRAARGAAAADRRDRGVHRTVLASAGGDARAPARPKSQNWPLPSRPGMSSRQEEKERRKRERQEREAAAEGVRRPTQAHAARVRRRLAAWPSSRVVVAGRSSSAAATTTRRRGRRGRRGDPRPEGVRPQEGGRGRGLHPQATRPTRARATRRRNSRRPTTSRTRPRRATTSRSGTQDGIYDPGDTPELGKLVHTLEHGRIDVQYKPGTPATTVAQLETFMKENEDGYHMLLFQNGDEHAVRGRRHRVGPPARLHDHEPPGLRRAAAFREAYIDKGPEVVP